MLNLHYKSARFSEVGIMYQIENFSYFILLLSPPSKDNRNKKKKPQGLPRLVGEDAGGA